MKAEIKIPAVGESISEATIGEWSKKSGEFVKRDEVILTLETDKASVEVVAPNDGVLTTSANKGDVVKIGSVVAFIDTEGVASAGMPAPQKSSSIDPKLVTPAATTMAASPGNGSATAEVPLSPAVRRIVDEKGIDPSKVQGSGKGGRLVKSDVENLPAKTSAPAAPPQNVFKMSTDVLPKSTERVRRVPMTTIRKRIAERLVQAQHTAAILTTFNEVDMSAVMALREKYKDKYKERFGVSLGFMGFFVKAVIQALKDVPQVNCSIEGSDLIFKDYINIGVAVGTEKGLIVPVIRDADQLTIAGVEQAIKNFAFKARDGKISIDDLSDGTFTISNGGVYGSLMSTPILNPPQSAILRMHKI